jgi:hypothetical protein
MAELRLNNEVFILPDNWNQLTEEQLIRVASLWNLGLSQNEFKLYLLVSILGLTVPRDKKYSLNGESCYRLMGKTKSYLISLTDLAIVNINSLGFLFKETETPKGIRLELDCKLVKTVIKYIEVDGEKWYGPGDAMNNCIYEEYIRALVSASEFSETKNISALNKLVATLYRTGGKDNAVNGDLRIPFNDFTVDQDAKKLDRIPESVKHVILLQFNGALYHMSQVFEYAFKKGSGKLNAKNIFLQQLDLVDNLADHKIPDKEAIRKTQLYDVLHTLDNLIKTKKRK